MPTIYLSDELRDQIADFSVGFILVDRSNPLGSRPLGSGTFVTIGGVKGILTAAHVVRELRRHREVGVVLFSSHLKIQAVTFAPADAIAVNVGNKDDENGPDLAFLRLPPIAEKSIESSVVHFNFDKRSSQMTPVPVGAGWLVYMAAGVVAEKTEAPALNAGSGVISTVVSALLTPGYLSKEVTGNQGFDLFDLNLEFADEGFRPKSFGGMSGGAVWAVKYALDGKAIVDKAIMGVIFYEREDNSGRLVVRLHGPKGIYGALATLVVEQFQEAGTVGDEGKV